MKYLSHAARLERAAQLLEESEAYRVARRLPDPNQRMAGNRPPDDATCVALVDVETTSLDARNGEIIELAILLAWVSDDGEVLAHLGPWSWLNDPGEPLTPEIVRLTRLTDADLREHRIDDAKVRALLDRADWVCAHHAAFDIQWFDRRYPELAGRPWACSCTEIDWRGLGFEGRGQPGLLLQHGWFTNAHRAGDDVWGLLQLLKETRAELGTEDIRTHFARLLERASQPNVRVSARGAPYAAKDALKARGYTWNALQRVWTRLFALDEVAGEEAWFRQEALPAPQTQTVTAVERHR